MPLGGMRFWSSAAATFCHCWKSRPISCADIKWSSLIPPIAAVFEWHWRQYFWRVAAGADDDWSSAARMGPTTSAVSSTHTGTAEVMNLYPGIHNPDISW